MPIRLFALAILLGISSVSACSGRREAEESAMMKRVLVARDEQSDLMRADYNDAMNTDERTYQRLKQDYLRRSKGTFQESLVQRMLEEIGLCEMAVDNMTCQAKILNEQSPNNLELILAKLGVFLWTLETEKGGVYGPLNFAIQTSCYHDMKGQLGFIRSGYRKVCELLPRLTFQGNGFFRGMRYMSDDQFAKFKEGQFWRFPSFLAFSRELKVARDFQTSDDSGTTKGIEFSVCFYISLFETARVLCIEEMSALPEEKEILFEPFETFRVVRVAQTVYDEKGEHHPEQVGRGIIFMEALGTNAEQDIDVKMREHDRARFMEQHKDRIRALPSQQDDPSCYSVGTVGVGARPAGFALGVAVGVGARAGGTVGPAARVDDKGRKARAGGKLFRASMQKGEQGCVKQ